MAATRRSSRLTGSDLNGRGYLSDQLGCTVSEVDCWITSKNISRPLKKWYQQCVMKGEASNTMLELIKSGNFEKPNNVFEKDILHTALGQRDRPSMGTDAPYMRMIHIWAAIAKNVVEASRSYTPTFADLATHYHEKFLAIAIDLLCLIFHSILYRGQGSIYASMIGNVTADRRIEPRPIIYESDTTDTEESDKDGMSTDAEDRDRDGESNYSDTTENVSRMMERDDRHNLSKFTEYRSDTEDSELTEFESIFDDDEIMANTEDGNNCGSFEDGADDSSVLTDFEDDPSYMSSPLPAKDESDPESLLTQPDEKDLLLKP
ncbi:hypothetical protein MBLNU457_g0152t1 [Dothideomycetes sp. NU457]